MATLRLISDAALVDPALDAAISRALMLRVAAGELADTLRISRPGPSVAFGRRDRIAAGYPAAVAAARSHGFEATERLAGGRAAVFHEGTIHVGHSLRDPDSRTGVTPRFDATAALLCDALRSLGVDARVGEVEGEYCPGAHSVSASGRTKLAGIGQRVVRDGAHMGVVVVVDGAERIKAVLEPVYDVLELDWRPDTTGSLSAEDGAIGWARASAAIEAAYAGVYRLEPAELDAETIALAERLAPEHVSARS